MDQSFQNHFWALSGTERDLERPWAKFRADYFAGHGNRDFFQNIHGRQMVFNLFPTFVFVILLAASNAFVEETIYRLSFTSIGMNEGLPPKLSQTLSAITFGTVHYFGNPAGIPGVLLAGFLGWMLAKTINETKRFFWAWFIHFLQDIIILSALFMT